MLRTEATLHGHPVTVIDLNHPWDYCCLCSQKVPMQYGIAMYEGRVVFDEENEEWAGFTACRACYMRVEGFRSVFNFIRAALKGESR